jgi:ABC-type branched-subunit amino acid transport system substrate-binding protein
LYKSGSYEIASTHFERSLQQKPNDPESLIYRNNAAALALTAHMTETLNRKRAVVYFNSESDYSKSLKGELNTAIALQGGQVVREYDLADDNFNPNLSLNES